MLLLSVEMDNIKIERCLVINKTTNTNVKPIGGPHFIHSQECTCECISDRLKLSKRKLFSNQPTDHSTSERNTSFWLCDVIMYDVDSQLEYIYISFYVYLVYEIVVFPHYATIYGVVVCIVDIGYWT